MNLQMIQRGWQGISWLPESSFQSFRHFIERTETSPRTDETQTSKLLLRLKMMNIIRNSTFCGEPEQEKRKGEFFFFLSCGGDNRQTSGHQGTGKKREFQICWASVRLQAARRPTISFPFSIFFFPDNGKRNIFSS